MEQPDQPSARTAGGFEKTGQWLNRRFPLDVFVYAILFLFFIQLLTGLVENTYAFGLLQTSVPYQAASIFLLFTPLALWIFPDLGSSRSAQFIMITGELVFLCRAVSGMLDQSGQMVACGLGSGLFLLFFPVLLWKLGKKGNLGAAYRMGSGLALAVLLSILLRSLYAGNDISDYGVFRAIPWLLGLAGGAVLPALIAAIDADADARPSRVHHSRWRASLQALGITSVFVLLYFAFCAPTVIARWTDFSYPAITFLAGGGDGPVPGCLAGQVESLGKPVPEVSCWYGTCSSWPPPRLPSGLTR